MLELDYKENWAPKNWRFWTVVLEKTLESPLDCKEIQPVHPKGNQSWIFSGRADAETEAPILWPPDVKNWLIGKDPDAGKDWGQEEKGMTEDEMVWMTSPTRWTWVWGSSRSWWWTRRPGVLQSMGLQSRTWLSDWTATKTAMNTSGWGTRECHRRMGLLTTQEHAGSRVMGKGLVSGWWAVCVCGVRSGVPKFPGLPCHSYSEDVGVVAAGECSLPPWSTGRWHSHKHPASTYCVPARAGRWRCGPWHHTADSLPGGKPLRWTTAAECNDSWSRGRAVRRGDRGSCPRGDADTWATSWGSFPGHDRGLRRRPRAAGGELEIGCSGGEGCVSLAEELWLVGREDFI